MKSSKLITLLRTVRYLRVQQVVYRIWYFFLNKLGLNYRETQAVQHSSHKLNFSYYPKAYTSNVGDDELCFLNLEIPMPSKIDWNHSGFGKLWTYNLNYFEFLHQTEINDQKKKELLDSFVSSKSHLKDGIEPYPISLRSINWIRYFSSQKNLNTKVYDSLLFSHLSFLERRLEYHLLANHLLENAFALLMGGAYFRMERWQKKGFQILNKQLPEQILSDGAHFERSPMYHNIILYRVLEAIDLCRLNEFSMAIKAESLLRKYASKMLGWLEKVTFHNGDIPTVSDSAFQIAPSSNEIFQLARQIGVSPENVSPGQSGYRMWQRGKWELFLNIGCIKASYQPGHAHADTLTFLLHYDGKPVIVDTGTSTYQKDERRFIERSTSSHNTISIDEHNSSEMWDGFRVGRRAKTFLKEEKPNQFIRVLHNGYKFLGIKHQREFVNLENEIKIEDKLIPADKKTGQSHLHFHPNCQIELKEDQIIVNNQLIIKLEGFNDTALESYFFAQEFNKLEKSLKFKGSFLNHSSFIISEL